MTIRELMLEVEHEIEAARQSGAWEFDYHAAMEEVDALLNNSLRSLAVDAETVEEPDIVIEPVEDEEVVAAPDEAEATVEAAPERRDVFAFSEREKDLLCKLMKGARKGKADETNLLFCEIIHQRPTNVHQWGELYRKRFPGRVARPLIERFKRVGAVEWDGDLKHDVVWL